MPPRPALLTPAGHLAAAGRPADAQPPAGVGAEGGVGGVGGVGGEGSKGGAGGPGHLAAARRPADAQPPASARGVGGAGGPGHLAAARRPADAQLAALAGPRHLVFALAELVDLGLSARAVRHRVAAGRLHRVHVGVYALVPSPLLTARGRYRAATLACGASASLSHRAAADLHDLRESHRRCVEVIVPGRATHRHPRIQVHRATHLQPQDLTVIDGIRATTVARTMLDLAAVLVPRQLERTLDQAEILRVFDLVALADQLRRNPHHPGTGRLRATLGQHTAGSTPTASELEERMLALTDAHHLPRPEINAPVDPGDGGVIIRPDFVWRQARLAVEVDGVQTHLTRHAFEDDRHRDQRLTLAGWRVIRITWRQLAEAPARIAELLRAVLGYPPTG